MSALDVDDVTKRYGDVTALDGVSLSVGVGESVGLVGTNGAGKTTLFRLLVGHEAPDGGTVRVAGRTAGDGPAVRERVGYLPEAAGFQPALTGREVLRFHARMRGVPRERRERRVARVLATVGLADDADRRVGEYSNGMTRRLGLGTTLLGAPRVLLLDEPTASLDPAGVEAFHRVVESIHERTDVAVVVTSHALDEVERLCDRAVVLDDGTVRARGSIPDLRRLGGERATVTAVPAGPPDPGALHDLAAEFPGVTVTAADPRYVLECPRETVYDLVPALRDLGADPPESLEVREASLADAFHAVVDDSPATPDAAATTAGGEGT